MREIVSMSLRIMSVFFLVKNMPDLLQLVDLYDNYDSANGVIDQSFYFYLSVIITMGLCLILFFCSGGIARIIVPKNYENTVELKLSKRAIYISSGLVLAALNLPGILGVFVARNRYTYYYAESAEESLSMTAVICYTIIVILSYILIKIGKSCEE